jgi:hypothetical protein
MKKLLSLCLATLFLGCTSTSVESIQGPDGSAHHLLTCGDVKDCYERAAIGCSGKYQIVNTSQQIYRDSRGRPDNLTKLLVKCQK